MGNINIKLQSFQLGIDFIEFQQIITCIPGNTFIKNLNTVQNPTLATIQYVIEAENDNFSDGTIINGKYRRTSVVNAGVTRFIMLFDGIEIIDPPAANLNQNNTRSYSIASQGPVITSGGYTVPLSTNTTYTYATSYTNATANGSNNNGQTVTNKVVIPTVTTSDNTTGPKKCVCEFGELMKDGCKCGGI